MDTTRNGPRNRSKGGGGRENKGRRKRANSEGQHPTCLPQTNKQKSHQKSTASSICAVISTRFFVTGHENVKKREKAPQDP